MRLTTERKVCAGVLALAVAALGVDRLFLGGATGPASASAAPTGPELARPASPADAAPRPPIMGSTVPVAKQLAALETISRDIDAFAPPSRWQKALADAQAAETARAERPGVQPDGEDPGIKRLMRHQLTAVLSKDGTPIKALIKVMDGANGRASSRLFAVGDELEGFTLRTLDNSSVTFVDESGNRAVDLELPVGGEAGGSKTIVRGPDKQP